MCIQLPYRARCCCRTPHTGTGYSITVRARTRRDCDGREVSRAVDNRAVDERDPVYPRDAVLAKSISRDAYARAADRNRVVSRVYAYARTRHWRPITRRATRIRAICRLSGTNHFLVVIGADRSSWSCGMMTTTTTRVSS